MITKNINSNEILDMNVRAGTDPGPSGMLPVFTSSALPSCRASPSIGQYQIILLVDRGTRMLTICPELVDSIKDLKSNT